MRTVAFLVDGSFYLKRYFHFRKIHHLLNFKKPHQILDYLINDLSLPTNIVAQDLTNHCLKHLENHMVYDDKHGGIDKQKSSYNEKIYRIFFYDCPPISKKAHHPITKKAVDLSKSKTFTFRQNLYTQIKCSRNFALRLGILDEKSARWRIKNLELEKQIISGEKQISDIDPEEVVYMANQKEVDLKIGLDIATITYKKLADKIVLITGDSDFVPASKLARREGIEVILDPMGANIKPSLQEHVDGVSTPKFNFDNNDDKMTAKSRKNR